jgi:Protein of unknown function (DUF3999)
MKRIAGLIVCGALAATAGAQDDALRRYAATAPVTLTSADGLQRLELPLPVLQASRAPGYADVRLFDAGGTALPQAWAGAPPTAPPGQRSHAVPRFAWPQRAGSAASDSAGTRVQINAAGAVVRIFGAAAPAPSAPSDPQRWLLDLSALPRPDGERWDRIALDWPRRAGGLSTTVRVEASDDAQQWRFVTQTALLELDGDAQAPAHKHIDWPVSAGRPKYLRLAVDAPLALTRSELVVRSEPAAAALASQRFPFAADADPAVRAWSLDALGALPVARLQVHLPTPNSVLALRLEQRHDQKAPWQTVASFVAWRLVREGQESVAPPLAVSAAPARHWRLVADARTPLPALDSLDATLEWHAPLLVFAARGALRLTLAVGRDKPVTAALPLATLMPGWRSGDEFKLPPAAVGALTIQPSVTPGLPERLSEATDEDRRRWVLWGALALAVVGLAWLAARLARDVHKDKNQTRSG